MTFLPNCQQNCQNSPMQVLTDTTGKNGISEQISSGAWIWPQTEIKSKAHELKPTLFSVWLYFLQATHLTPGVSNTNWSWVPLDVHKDRHVRALWLMWWGAGTFSQGLSGRADERSAGSRDGLVGSVGFQLHLFWGVQGLLVPPMVAENCLSRNLKPEAERGKKNNCRQKFIFLLFWSRCLLAVIVWSIVLYILLVLYYKVNMT